MSNTIPLYLAAALTSLWGIAHLFPTRSIVRDFGDISQDNQRIITMEWIVEGVALIFIGILVTVVTWLDPESVVSTGVYVVAALQLLTLAVVSLFTGFRVDFIPFRLCPLIFTISAILILLGTFI
jgi:hypothetical protein